MSCYQPSHLCFRTKEVNYMSYGLNSSTLHKLAMLVKDPENKTLFNAVKQSFVQKGFTNASAEAQVKKLINKYQK